MGYSEHFAFLFWYLQDVACLHSGKTDQLLRGYRVYLFDAVCNSPQPAVSKLLSTQKQNVRGGSMQIRIFMPNSLFITELSWLLKYCSFLSTTLIASFKSLNLPDLEIMTTPWSLLSIDNLMETSLMNCNIHNI